MFKNDGFLILSLLASSSSALQIRLSVFLDLHLNLLVISSLVIVVVDGGVDSVVEII